jgi:hypothetical protein
MSDSLITPGHIFSSVWDNNAPGGNGSWNVWQDGRGDYYADYNDLVDPDDLDKLQQLAEVQGPYRSLEDLYSAEGQMLFAIGPATVSVTSKVHTATELAELLIVESSLVEELLDEEDRDLDWTILVNGVEFHVNALNGIGAPVHQAQS